MSFWLALAAMLAAGLGLLALPAGRAARAREDAARRDQLRRLDELDEDLAAGEIDAALGEEVRLELERSLLAHLEPSAPEQAPRGDRAARIAVLLAVPLIAVGTYLATGSPRIGEFAATHPELRIGSPEAAVELLLAEVRERTRDAPGDQEAWRILAHTNLELGRYEQAAAAAEALYGLAPRDPAALLLLIDARAMMHAGRIEGRTAELIDEVLALDAGNVDALTLKGIAAAQDGDNDHARSWWRRALAGMEPDAPMRARLEQMIAQSGGAATPGRAQVAAGTAVHVEVSLDPALEARTRPDDTVFVIARALDGSPAPLAVSRHTTAELPLAVTLDDSMAVVPGRSLADVEQIYVVARVSRHHGVRAESGDLEGRSDNVVPGTRAPVRIVIDRVLP